MAVTSEALGKCVSD